MTATYAQTHHSNPGTSTETRGAPNAAGLSSRPSNKALWTGRILSGLAVLFLLFDATIKVLAHPEAVQTTAQLGYPSTVVFGLGLVQLVCLAVYLIPRTSVLGAVLWTGYLGGAIATHVRVGNPLFSHVLFPTYVAAFLWLGLWLRDERLRAVLPFRATK
ncbi:DoxX family protein [Archangium lansingense]|uniref:DoxX family protein n=1 Tax=Archangium lansingense TaxID=2995310 RepID=A0ABT4AJ71_9BACT|nr:DoxX family protein [Archangium lansinium]MCY1081626.1 DoxX family protein [Archangium lansinium]